MARALTQEEVAERLKIHQGSYSRIERADPKDHTAGVTPSLAKKIAKVFRRQRLSAVHVIYPHDFPRWKPRRS